MEKIECSREKELLAEALIEIKYLRKQNEKMAARLDMFDRIDRMINAEIPRQGGEYSGPDVCQEIESFLDGEVKAAG